VLEGYRFLAAFNQPLVQEVQHLKERHAGIGIVQLVLYEAPSVAPVPLPPDEQGEFHL
jgi:hypothetical protein